MNELVPSMSIDNLLQQRDSIIERAGEAIRLLKEAAQIAKSANVRMPVFSVRGSYSGKETNVTGDYAQEGIEFFRENVDASAWDMLMRESGMMTFMDAQARKEWGENLHELKNVPPLTRGTIEATFKELHDSRGEIFERGILNAFKSLSWNYKTNSPWLFGKRIIVTHLVNASVGYITSNFSPCDRLDDLTRLFFVLDGKSEPDHRNGWYSIIRHAIREKKQLAENEYLTIKWFKNGNGHVTFKRPDLVDRMNNIISKHHPNALPHDN